ncbi:hypothetical protein LX32DRAFT_79817 [Colletotrichum zoysiae]|uniref:Secreted protein n=1 Tax=Colletotrichum zoysiae TaxID=1216348 RepID=A0AAD9H9G1_9PEZI|nr:hypothetical protein LX32DRAFT_79817 [Colletotrichum zoysiae]
MPIHHSRADSNSVVVLLLFSIYDSSRASTFAIVWPTAHPRFPIGTLGIHSIPTGTLPGCCVLWGPRCERPMKHTYDVHTHITSHLVALADSVRRETSTRIPSHTPSVLIRPMHTHHRMGNKTSPHSQVRCTYICSSRVPCSYLHTLHVGS